MGYHLVHTFPDNGVLMVCVSVRKGCTRVGTVYRRGSAGMKGGCDGKLVALKIQWGGEKIYGTKKWVLKPQVR